MRSMSPAALAALLLTCGVATAQSTLTLDGQTSRIKPLGARLEVAVTGPADQLCALVLDDMSLERVHDYIQWLFPLMEPSRAVPGSPVLSAAERDLIRGDESLQQALLRAAARMQRFYDKNDHWLRAYDHNHLRITRILRALRMLVGVEAAEGFLAAVMARHLGAGHPVNPQSVAFWQEALQ